MSETNNTPIQNIEDIDLTDPAAVKALIIEVQDRGSKAVLYKKQIDEATSDAKRAHFAEMLTANNEIALQLLTILDQIDKVRESNETPISEGNAITPSTPEDAPK